MNAAGYRRRWVERRSPPRVTVKIMSVTIDRSIRAKSAHAVVKASEAPAPAIRAETGTRICGMTRMIAPSKMMHGNIR